MTAVVVIDAETMIIPDRFSMEVPSLDFFVGMLPVPSWVLLSILDVTLLGLLDSLKGC